MGTWGSAGQQCFEVRDRWTTSVLLVEREPQNKFPPTDLSLQIHHQKRPFMGPKSCTNFYILQSVILKMLFGISIYLAFSNTKIIFFSFSKNKYILLDWRLYLFNSSARWLESSELVIENSKRHLRLIQHP